MNYESKFCVGDVVFSAKPQSMDSFCFDGYFKASEEALEEIKSCFNVVSQHKINSVSFKADDDGDIITVYNTVVLEKSSLYDKNSKVEVCEDFAFKTKKEAYDYILRTANLRLKEFVENFKKVKTQIENELKEN